jgi:hypothetical protein
MSLKIEDPQKWRGRSQLDGTQTADGTVIYVAGAKVVGPGTVR